MDQEWGEWQDGEYHGDAETADLGDPDEPLASGFGGYDDPNDGGEPGGSDATGYPSGESGDAGPAGSGGFLEDDPMGAFGNADGGPEQGHDGSHDGSQDGDDGAGGRDPGDQEVSAALTDAGPVADPYAEPAESAADPAGTDDGTGDSGAASPETVVGADPDVDPDADWTPAEFPEQLDFAAPEPVDGYPWTDPSAVAAPGTGGEDPSTGPDGAPPAQDLLDYAGAEGGTDPWAALLGSDDPAASSLGRWWSPGA